MIASVYCTRARGAKLPRPTEPVQGNFLLVKGGRGDVQWLDARLVDNNVDRLRPLIKAQVTRVSDHGMVVEGVEVVTRTKGSKSNAETFRQVWWVFVLTQQAVDTFDGEDPLEAIAEQKHAAAGPSGF